jgi:hypothetical protein
VTTAAAAQLVTGSTTYVADYGAALNKFIGKDRMSRRVWHAIISMVSAFLILAAWLIAWVVHEYKGVSHIAKGGPVYVQVHIWLGLVGILGTIFQVGPKSRAELSVKDGVCATTSMFRSPSACISSWSKRAMSEISLNGTGLGDPLCGQPSS